MSLTEGLLRSRAACVVALATWSMAAAGCAKAPAAGGDGGSVEARGDRRDPVACEPGPPPGAKPLPAWRAPAGCTIKTMGQQMLKTSAELASNVSCTGAAAEFPAGSWLLVSSRTMSPAYAGTELYDDGKTLTFVTRQRSPCPTDPRPMPMSTQLAFVVPAGAERSFAESTCTMHTRCN
jgi:hypothetical protein